MHSKTDSEVTTISIAPSSPTRSPRPAAYYVQSPSRDSHDGEKTTTSFQSTPTGSPPHSHSSVGHHSRESSSSRFSGSLKDGSRKVYPNDATHDHDHDRRKHHKKIDVIEEEGLLDDEDYQKSLPRRCYLLIFVLGFFLLFTVFSFILWGASKPQKPKVTIKNIKFETLVIQAGSDNSGVATDMITVNATIKLNFRNTATFFGLHVKPTPVYLDYSQITLASGSIKKFYQSRKSQRLLTVSLTGSRVPLYGSGATLSSLNGVPTVPVPLKLNFVVKSRGYVLGKLVKPRFDKKVECSVVYDPKKHNNVAISLNNSCTYD